MEMKSLSTGVRVRPFLIVYALHRDHLGATQSVDLDNDRPAERLYSLYDALRHLSFRSWRILKMSSLTEKVAIVTVASKASAAELQRRLPLVRSSEDG